MIATTWLAVVLAPLPTLAERGTIDGLADPAQGSLVWLLQKGLALEGGAQGLAAEGGGGPPAPTHAAHRAEAAETQPRNGTAEKAAHRSPVAVEIPGDAQLAPGLLGAARLPAGPAAAWAPPPTQVPGLNASGRDGLSVLLSAAAVSAGARLSQETPRGGVESLAHKEWASRIVKGSFVAKSSRVFVGRYDESVTAFERRWHEGRVLLVVFVMLLLWTHFQHPSPSPMVIDEDEVDSRRDAPAPSTAPSATLPGSAVDSLQHSRRASARPSRVPSRFSSHPPSRCHSPARLPGQLQEECRFSRHTSGS